jgi:hypothetical protein
MKRLVLTLAVLLGATLFAPSARARVLDDFNDNTRTGWQDFAFPVGVTYSQIVEQNGQLQFTLQPVGQSIFAATTKTSETFELKEGRTIEFRVDLVSGNGPDSFALLAFIPTSSTVSSLAGYGFAKSTTDILVTKALDKYFYNDDPDEPIKNENVTMVLSLSVKDGNVMINSKVLDKDAGNAVIFDRTFIDSPAKDILADGEDNGPAYFGAGNFVLLCYEDNGTTQESYEIILDNAEVFVTDSFVLDDFNDNAKTAWQDFAFPVGVTYSEIVEESGQLRFTLQPVGQPIFAASTKTSATFDLVEGERVEFRVDLVHGEGADSFAVMAFIPSSSSVSALNGYGFSKSETDILVSKALDKYFFNQNPTPAIKNQNITMVLTLTVRNSSVHIDTKVLDKDADNAVIFERSFVDTPEKDVLDDGEDNGPPYLGSGNFVLLCYEDNGTTQPLYEVIFDNAEVNAAPLAANAPPSITALSPAASANFLPVSTPLTFEVRDDDTIADSGISLFLNGETVTSGVTITGAGTTKTVTFAGLAANQNYSARLIATDSDGASITNSLHFDTFAPELFVIESEDFNFGGGQYISDPVPMPEGSGPHPNAYVNQTGIPGIDYSDTRTTLSSVPYRFEDFARMRQTLDFPRAKFIAAGGTPAGVFDYDVGDIAAGEWLNYTRDFAPGNYLVFLREAVNNGTAITTTLEEVTSDPTLEEQTTRVLGSFFVDVGAGFQFRNHPLQDGVGQPVVLNLSGRQTLRVRQTTGSPADGSIFQNYLVFIPTAGVSQRATVSALSPPNGTTVESVAPQITATILNRDTDVVASSIKLYINGGLVTPTITATEQGATLSHALAPRPDSGSTIQARLEFADSENVVQTNAWSFTVTYTSLNAANRAAGAGVERGLRMRVVQSLLENGPLENSLSRAEDQLKANSPFEKFVDTNRVVQVVNFNEFEGDAGQIPGDQAVPGLEPDLNGSDDFAVEFQAYLELSAGVHRFGVISDDGFKINSGTSLTDQTTSPLSFRNGGTANQTFEFVVPAAGLYPFRMVWYERGGSAHAEWFSVDLETGARTLINDPDVPTAIKAFTSISAPALSVESSSTVDGTYALDGAAVIDATARRVTIPVAATGHRFFRINAQAAQRITSATVSGGTLTLSYQPQ